MVAKLLLPGSVMTGAASLPAGIWKFAAPFPRQLFLTMMLSVPETYRPYPFRAMSCSADSWCGSFRVFA
jgi:hypothetical protein